LKDDFPLSNSPWVCIGQWT